MKKILSLIWKYFTAYKDSAHFVSYLRKKGIQVGERVNFRVPEHTSIDITRPEIVTFGNDVDVNDNFTLLTHDFGTFVFKNLYNDFVNSSGSVIIGNNIVFGKNVTVLKGVEIGDNCIIGANSLVTKSIPSNSVAAGVPARVICSIEEYYEKRKIKSIQEGIDYGIAVSVKKAGNISIEDFSEEWCLFVTPEEYKTNDFIKRQIDSRFGNKAEDFLEKNKPFLGFKEFINPINNHYE